MDSDDSKPREFGRYSLEALKSLWVMSKDSPLQISKSLRIPLDKLQELAKQNGWESLRDVERDRFMELLSKSVGDTIKNGLDVELKLHFIQMMQIEDQIEWIMEYYSKYGDLFLRSGKDEQILLDSYNQPMPLRIPNSSYDIAKRKGNIELILNLQKVWRQFEEFKAAEEDKKGIKSANEFAYLLEEKNDTNE